MKNIFFFLFAILAFALGGFLTWQYTKPPERELISESTVLLNQVRKVFKLVTVEGDLTETYRGGDIKNLVFYLPFPMTYGAQKEAIIQVKGKVLVGYDMQQMKVEALPETQQITISNLPQPEILSIDHDLSYYNIEESWFNSFEADDYTKLNKDAKDRLREAALKSDLFEQARKQGNQLIDVIQFMVESMGWTLVYEGFPEVQQDTLLLH